MNAYDFRSLNDKEFEAVVVDLLSESFGVRLERFKPGRDGGVDGRWFIPEGGEGVVQCKHWLGSGFRKLLQHLRDHERKKLERLNPTRYIVATSIPLSRQNKRDLQAAMAPYILSDSDVLGAEDLNDLLQQHPSIEARHYKLWLSSSGTLTQLLNRAILGRSRAELQDIRDEASLYVQTANHDQALEHLGRERVLILTGEPGIGKTTLAKQLILEHVARGYDLVTIEESLAEAEAVYIEEQQQIFYFDDFLGRTYLEALKSKQDSHIAGFMKRVSRDASKRFVLTSRTNILNQGAVLSELYSHSRVTRSRYELTIKSLTLVDRARILYNHLWHSNLGVEYIDELYAQKRYNVVIRHRNYNPRLIAFILDSDKVTGVAPSEYWAHVEGTLGNPQDVWRHYFSAQLSQDCRDLVYITVLNGGQIAESQLRESFLRLPARLGMHPDLNEHDFSIASRHAAGSVLERRIAGIVGRVSYSLFNPSIADYVLRYLGGANLWRYYFLCVRTLDALGQLEQLKNQPFFGPERYIDVLRAITTRERESETAWDGYSLRLARLAMWESTLQRECASFLRDWISSPRVEVARSLLGDYFTVLMGWRAVMSPEQFASAVTCLPTLLRDNLIPIDQPETLASLINDLAAAGLQDSVELLRSKVIEEWSEQMPQLLRNEDRLAEYTNPEDSTAIERELEDVVRGYLREAGIELTRVELKDLCSTIDLGDIVDRNIATAMREDDADLRRREGWQVAVDDGAAVDDLFDRSNQ